MGSIFEENVVFYSSLLDGNRVLVRKAQEKLRIVDQEIAGFHAKQVALVGGGEGHALASRGGGAH